MHLSPSLIHQPTSRVLKALLNLNDDSKLYTLHTFLISHFRTTEQFQTLYSRTIKIEQLFRDVPLLPIGWQEEVKKLYLLQFEDYWLHDHSENRLLSLALRCEQAFHIIINHKSVLEKDYSSNEIIGIFSLGKELKDSETQLNDVLEHIIKPLYRDNLNLYLIALRYFSVFSKKIFFEKFIGGLSQEKLCKFLIFFLLPCIRTKESCNSIAQLLDFDIFPRQDLTHMKDDLRNTLINHMGSWDQKELKKVSLGIFRILIKDPGVSEVVDPEPGNSGHISVSNETLELLTKFDPPLASDFLAYIAAPLFCTSWRIKRATSLLFYHLELKDIPEKPISIKACKFLFQKTVLNLQYRKKISQLFPIIISFLVGEAKTAQVKRKRPKVIYTPLKKPKNELNDRKKTGRSLIFSGYIFKPVTLAVKECFNCSRTNFREHYPARELRWAHGFYKKRPITEEYKKRCVEIISNAMKYFNIDNESKPEEVFNSLVAREII